jgi:hypothetical protein
MATTRQVISKTLILPAIGSFQYLAAVDPGLRTANDAALVPYVNTVDSDLSFVINGNGTLDIYNVSGKNLSAGKRIVVSAVEHLLNLPVGAEQTITTAATTPSVNPVQVIPPMVATAPDTLTFTNTPVIVTFDSSSVLPLVTKGYVDDPGGNGGAFVIRKPGSYSFQGNFIFCATAGAAGYITVQMYQNGAAQASTTYRQAVNFGAGDTDKSLSLALGTVITQAALDAAGGTRTLDWRISTNVGTITGKLGTAVSNTPQSCTMLVSYDGPDYFTAAP